MREIPVPTPKEGEVLLKVEWTGANYIDNCEFVRETAASAGIAPVEGRTGDGRCCMVWLGTGLGCGGETGEGLDLVEQRGADPAGRGVEFCLGTAGSAGLSDRWLLFCGTAGPPGAGSRKC